MGNNLSGVFRLLPIAIGFFIIAAIAGRGCTKGPFGRSQVITISPAQELQLGREAYQSVLSEEGGHVVKSGPELNAVREVGERLRQAAEDPAVRKMLNINPNLQFEWEFSLVDSPQINAFCLPGGKVVVYTGILPVCRSVGNLQAGLAVVMGHEIGHALARHGAERMTRQEMVNIAQFAVASSLGNMDARNRAMVLAALGAGSEIGVLLPFSRAQESEADHIGIILMAAAGYDPRIAPRFWEAMSEKGGRHPPEFLSTHPNDEKRMHDLERWASTEAMSIFDRSPHVSLETPKRKIKPKVATKGEGWEIK